MGKTEFRTTAPLATYAFRIGHDTPLLSLGSCFAEHIGQRLEQRKFPVLSNPFGIVFNPISLGEGILRLTGTSSFSRDDLFMYEDRWLSFLHHGSFSDPDPGALLERMNARLMNAREQFRRSRFLLLTLGTAHVWERTDNGEVVANCHKLPSSFFRRRRAGVEEVIRSLEQAFEAVWMNNPDLEVLLTVSPVRHLRDGMIENQRSKSVLLLATGALEERFGQVHYFPAYELLMDDLRDYRFYARDMIHPSELAVDYIWSYFQEALIDAGSKKLIAQLERVHLAMEHRPLRPGSAEYRDFAAAHLRKVEALEKSWPGVNFIQEKEFFKHIAQS